MTNVVFISTYYRPDRDEELRLRKMQEFLYYCMVEFHQRNRHLERHLYDKEKKAVHERARKLITLVKHS
jgi:hypothetical protein